jgi:hypothetical protein
VSVRMGRHRDLPPGGTLFGVFVGGRRVRAEVVVLP